MKPARNSIRSPQLILLILFFSAIVNAQWVPVDLGQWQQEGLLANGNWSISADSLSVTQSINGAPTFFVTPDTLINTTIRGQLVVNGSDNDFIGFVFGYQRPVGEEEYIDCYLLDWKAGTQSFPPWTAEEGFTLSRVQGTVTGNLASGSHPFWAHEDSAVQVIDTHYGSDEGWVRAVPYIFELLYEENRIKIDIDSVTIFDTTGVFLPGRFGFYNYSQPNVTYSEFTVNRAPVANPDSATTMENIAVSISVLDNDFDPDNHPLTIESFTQPQNGIVSLDQGDSSFTYQPDSSFWGDDQFTYTISDSNGGNDSALVALTVEVVGAIGNNPAGNPETFQLYANYPNPFNPETTIEFLLPTASVVSLEIYNIKGQRVVKTHHDAFLPGLHHYVWNGTDQSGNPVASGIYFYRLHVGKDIKTRQMLLIR